MPKIPVRPLNSSLNRRSAWMSIKQSECRSMSMRLANFRCTAAISFCVLCAAFCSSVEFPLLHSCIQVASVKEAHSYMWQGISFAFTEAIVIYAINFSKKLCCIFARKYNEILSLTPFKVWHALWEHIFSSKMGKCVYDIASGICVRICIYSFVHINVLEIEKDNNFIIAINKLILGI